MDKSKLVLNYLLLAIGRMHHYLVYVLLKQQTSLNYTLNIL